MGIYSIAAKISSIVGLGITALNAIAAPKFAEYWIKGDKKGLLKLARQSTAILFWTTLPILFFIFIFTNHILGFFGNEFKKGVFALIILIVGQFINVISGSTGYILDMTGFQDFAQWIIIISFALNVILNILLIPKYGINGAAIASALTIIFWNIIMSFKIKKILDGWIFYVPIKF